MLAASRASIRARESLPGEPSMTTVKAALVQCAWTGNKDSMIERHAKYIADAAKQGAQVMCLQELFYGPYFCQVQDTKHYSYTEKIPDGPTTKLMQELAKKHSMVLIVPMYEEDQVGVYYNTAAVIDAAGKYLGKYRKTHIRQVHRAGLGQGRAAFSRRSEHGSCARSA